MVLSLINSIPVQCAIWYQLSKCPCWSCTTHLEWNLNAVFFFNSGVTKMQLRCMYKRNIRFLVHQKLSQSLPVCIFCFFVCLNSLFPLVFFELAVLAHLLHYIVTFLYKENFSWEISASQKQPVCFQPVFGWPWRVAFIEISFMWLYCQYWTFKYLYAPASRVWWLNVLVNK